MKICPTCRLTYSDDIEFCPHDGAQLIPQAKETEAQFAASLSRRFRIVRRLGEGGMGTVFLAEQIGVGNRLVALKVLLRSLLDNPDFLRRFQEEAASTGRIRHPNVVTIYESGQADDGTPYIAMEFLEGESLRQALQRRGQLPVPEVAEILQQAARGLNAAHKLGIIHRDLKPDNIFLTYADDVGAGLVPALPAGIADAGRPQGPPLPPAVVKIVDFGIAKLRESATHTQTGMVLGTPAYMSYEQASGMRSDELDARSDIYSLGVVVYEMLSGRVPFHSDTPLGYLRKHMLEQPPPFRAIAQGLSVPPAVESAVMKALSKDRDQRYPSALDFARELATAAQPSPRGEAPMPFPPSRILPPPAPKAIQPHPSAKVAVPLPAIAQAKADIAVQTPPPAPPERIVGAPSPQPQGSKPVTRASPPLAGANPPHSQIATKGSSRAKFFVLGLVVLAFLAVGQLYFRGQIFGWLMLVAIAGAIRYFRIRFAVVLGTALIVIVAGVWYFLQHRERDLKSRVPTAKQANSHTSWAAEAGKFKGEVRVNPNDGLKYVWIPPGSFMMGCSPGDSECADYEKPPHQVAITNGFWLGQTEVTVGAYKRYVAAAGRQLSDEKVNPPTSGWINETMPMDAMGWGDARAYCYWAGGRLPTEAEWEYAARAGSTAAGYGDLDEIAWYADNSGRQHLDSATIQDNFWERLKNNGNELHEVGQKRPNGFGLYDMLGNVAEMVNDWYDPNYYKNSPSQDPPGPERSDTGKVIRGAAYYDSPKWVRVSHRAGGVGIQSALGFRCAGEASGP